MAIDLSKFKATQAVAVSLKLTGPLGIDQVVTVAYDDGKFTVDTHVVGGPLGQVELLDAQQEKALLDALKQEQHRPHPGVDGTVLQCFIHLLTGAVHKQPSTLFDHARFGDIARDSSGVITAHVGQGVDVVGTLTDDHARLKYEQHPVPMKPQQPHTLSPADRASLVAALTKYIASAQPRANPLFDQLLADAQK
jgi:hypothetical protein